MKNKKFIMFLAVYSMIQIAILTGIYFAITSLKKEDISLYAVNSDTMVIKRYDENKEEETSVVVKGKKREQIIDILEHAPEDMNYNEERFDYQYKLNFGNGNAGYLDTNEKMFESYVFLKLTDEECRVIEDLFE